MEAGSHVHVSNTHSPRLLTEASHNRSSQQKVPGAKKTCWELEEENRKQKQLSAQKLIKPSFAQKSFIFLFIFHVWKMELPESLWTTHHFTSWNWLFSRPTTHKTSRTKAAIVIHIYSHPSGSEFDTHADLRFPVFRNNEHGMLAKSWHWPTFFISEEEDKTDTCIIAFCINYVPKMTKQASLNWIERFFWLCKFLATWTVAWCCRNCQKSVFPSAVLSLNCWVIALQTGLTIITQKQTFELFPWQSLTLT